MKMPPLHAGVGVLTWFVPDNDRTNVLRDTMYAFALMARAERQGELHSVWNSTRGIRWDLRNKPSHRRIWDHSVNNFYRIVPAARMPEVITLAELGAETALEDWVLDFWKEHQ